MTWPTDRACRTFSTSPETCAHCDPRWECLYQALRNRSGHDMRGGFTRNQRLSLLNEAMGDYREALVAAFAQSEQGLSWPGKGVA